MKFEDVPIGQHFIDPRDKAEYIRTNFSTAFCVDTQIPDFFDAHLEVEVTDRVSDIDEKEEEDDLIWIIQNNIDDESDPAWLRQTYEEAPADHKETIDKMFIGLTGWTFNNLLERADTYTEEE